MERKMSKNLQCDQVYHSMKKLIQTIVKNYTEKLQEVGIPITSAYLFGSHVKGTPRYGSDIDICIVSPLFGKDQTKDRVRLILLREGISDEIEPHPYSPEDFEIPYDPLASEIKRSGIKLSL